MANLKKSKRLLRRDSHNIHQLISWKNLLPFFGLKKVSIIPCKMRSSQFAGASRRPHFLSRNRPDPHCLWPGLTEPWLPSSRAFADTVRWTSVAVSRKICPLWERNARARRCPDTIGSPCISIAFSTLSVHWHLEWQTLFLRAHLLWSKNHCK